MRNDTILNVQITQHGELIRCGSIENLHSVCTIIKCDERAIRVLDGRIILLQVDLLNELKLTPISYRNNNRNPG